MECDSETCGFFRRVQAEQTLGTVARASSGISQLYPSPV